MNATCSARMWKIKTPCCVGNQKFTPFWERTLNIIGNQKDLVFCRIHPKSNGWRWQASICVHRTKIVAPCSTRILKIIVPLSELTKFIVKQSIADFYRFNIASQVDLAYTVFASITRSIVLCSARIIRYLQLVPFLKKLTTCERTLNIIGKYRDVGFEGLTLNHIMNSGTHAFASERQKFRQPLPHM
jgi:hypothetical protein